MFLRILRSLNWLRTPARTAAFDKAMARRSVRPQVESLEDRAVPASFWLPWGGGSGTENLDLAGGIDPLLTLHAPGQGLISFTNQSTTHTIQSGKQYDIGSQAVHVRLDFSQAGFGSGPEMATLQLNEAGTQLQIYVGGQLAFSADPDAVRSVSVVGSSSATTFIVKEVNGRLPTEAGGFLSNALDGHVNSALASFRGLNSTTAGQNLNVTFDGGTQAGNQDSLVLSFTSPRRARYFADNFAGAKSGNVWVSGLPTGGGMQLAFQHITPFFFDFTGIGGTVDADATALAGTLDLTIQDATGDPAPPGAGFTPVNWSRVVSSNAAWETIYFRGNDTLNVLGGTGSQTVTLESLNPGATVTTINLSGDNTTSTDAAANIINIRIAPLGVTVNAVAAQGNDTINIGSGGAGSTIDAILGTVNVVGGPGSSAVNVQDQGAAAVNTYTLSRVSGTQGRLARTGAGLINYTTAGISSFDVFAGSGGGTFNVTGSFAGTTVNIAGGTGNYSFNASGLDNVQGPVNINGNTGSSTLSVDDSANGNIHTYTLDTPTATTGTVARTAAGLITYANVTSLQVQGSAGGNTANIRGVLAATPTTFIGTGGNYTFNVGTVGNSLANILGGLTLTGVAGSVANLNDQGAAGAFTYTLTATTAQRTGTALITYSGMTGASGLTVNGAVGAGIVNVQSSASGTPINVVAGAGGGYTFNVGSAGNLLDGILGPVNLNGVAGSVLNVNDQASAAANAYTVTSTTVQRAGTALISYLGMTGASGVTLNAGTGGGTIGVASTAASTPVNLFAGSGSYTVNVGNGTGLGNINATGPVNVNGGTGTSSLNVNDATAAGPFTYTVTNSQIARTGVGAINYVNIAGTITLNAAGTGSNTINVQSTAAVTAQTVINAGAGGATVTVGQAGTLANIASPLQVNAQGGTTNLILDDSTTSTGQTFTVTPTSVARSGIAAIGFNAAMTSVTINGGTAGDTFTVTPSVTTVFTINGNAPTFTGTPPLDVLNLDSTGLSSVQLNLTGAGAGQFTFPAPTTRQAVNYTGIENLGSSPVGYDLQLSIPALGLVGSATIVRLDPTGVVLQLIVNGNQVFGGTASAVQSLSVLGSAGADSLTIQEVAGRLPTEAIGGGFGGSAGTTDPTAHLNSAMQAFLTSVAAPTNMQISFDGNGGPAGGDRLGFIFTTPRRARYAGDNVGGAPNARSGNVNVSGTGGAPASTLRVSFVRLTPLDFVGVGGDLAIDNTGLDSPDLTIQDDGVAGDGVSQVVSSDAFFETSNFSGFDSLTLLGGDGAQVINVNGLDSATTVNTINVTGDNFSGTDASVNTINIRNVPAAVTVNATAAQGNDIFNVGSATNTLTPILGTVNLTGGVGASVINVNDQGFAGATTYTISTTGAASGRVQRTGTGQINYFDPGFASLTLNAGSGGTVVDVTGTLAATPVFVNGGTGNYTFNVGNANTIDTILGAVSFNGGTGTSHLFVNDAATATTNTYVLDTPTATTGTVARSGGGPTPGLISYTNLASLTVNAGAGGNTVNVRGVLAATPTTVNGTGGNYTFNVGNLANNLNNILGSLTLNGVAGSVLNVNDQSSGAVNTYIVTSTTVQRVGTGLITYAGMTGTTGVTLNAGLGGGTATVQSTAHNTPVNVNGGTGNYTFNVGAANTIDGIATTGPVNFNGGTGTSNLFVNDAATATVNTYVLDTPTLTTGTVARSGAGPTPGLISYTNLASLTVNAGVGGNTVNVRGVLAATPTTVNGTGGNYTFNVGNLAGTIDQILGGLTLNGVTGSVLNVNDASNAASSTYIVTSTTVQRVGLGLITYSGMTGATGVTLNAGSGGGTATVQSTAANTPVNVNGGTGSYTFNVGVSNTINGVNATGPINFNGGAGVSNLFVNDAATVGANTYTHDSPAAGVGSIARTGVGLITYTNLATATINGGAGGNTANIRATLATTPLTFNAGAGAYTVNVGSAANNLDTILGELFIQGGTANSTVNINDQGNAVATIYNLARTSGTSARVERIGAALINYLNPGIATVNLNGGSGGNTFNVDSSISGTTVNMFMGTGSDVANFGNAANSLSDLVGPVNAIGQGGVNNVFFNDQGTATRQNYNLTTTTLTRSGTAALGYSGMATLTLNIANTPALNNVFINGAGAGITTINGGIADNNYMLNATNASAVTINGGPASDQFVINGTGTGVTTLNGFDGLNSFFVQSSVFNTPGLIRLNGGAGNDHFNFRNGGAMANGIIDGGVSGGDLLNYGGYTISTPIPTNVLGYTTPVAVSLALGIGTGLGPGGGRILGNIRNLRGGLGNNLLVGNNLGNVIAGGIAGTTTIIGGNGVNTLYGGSARARITSGLNADTILLDSCNQVRPGALTGVSITLRSPLARISVRIRPFDFRLDPFITPRAQRPMT